MKVTRRDIARFIKSEIKKASMLEGDSKDYTRKSARGKELDNP